VSIILRLDFLRTRFLSFLDERRKEPDRFKTAEEDYKIFDMIIKLQKLHQQTEDDGISVKDLERNARHFLRTEKAQLLSLPIVKDMVIPKHQHRRRHSEMPGEISMPCLSPPGGFGALEEDHFTYMKFIKQALDSLSEELMERECYEQFVEEKNWRTIDVQRFSLRQTIGKDGFVEAPTLAAVLHSQNYGPLILECLKDTEKHDQLSFLLDAQDFYSRYSKISKISLQDRKDMQTDAARIYDKYLEKSDLELPKRVKADIVKQIRSPSNKLTPLLFQTAGSWIYNRISKSWFREANSLVLYADQDYDNRSPKAVEMEVLFNISHINENQHLAGENLGLVPHPDDIVGNPQLYDSFRKFVLDTSFTNAGFDFLRGSKELLTVPAGDRVAKIEALIELLRTVTTAVPSIKPALEEIEQYYDKYKADLNPMVFWGPAFAITKSIMLNNYQAWVVKCKSVYCKGGWQPVQQLTLVGGHAVPGTTWVTALGVTTDTENVSVPSAKKRWGLRNLRRKDSVRSVRMESPPLGPLAATGIAGHKSISFQVKPGAPRVPFTLGKDDSSLSRDTSSSGDFHSSRSDGEGIPGTLLPAMPNSVPKSIPDYRMEIPTIHDTLACTLLRRMFYGSFLEYRLIEDEKNVWNALCKFHADFSSLTDAEVVQRQKDIRSAAMKVLEENPTIPFHDEMTKTLSEEGGFVTARFFFEAEVRLYSGFHNGYQTFLTKNQWVRY